MREMLFRGQTRKFGEKVRMGTGEKLPGQWAYGGIYPGTGAISVIYGWGQGEAQTGANLKKLPVYSDTVGQYAELTDKNGAKIFEGDLLRIDDNIFVVKYGKCGGVQNVSHDVGYIGFYKTCARIRFLTVG